MPLKTSIIIIFWLCIALLAQVYVFYPYTLKFLLLFKKKKFGTLSLKFEESYKKVSIIIAAYNEENIIEEKIKNTLSLDYPKDKIEILIGDDGSKDKTAELTAKYSEVRLIKQEKNEGKAAMLNNLCAQASGELFLFSDANTMLESSALKNIIAAFVDERVGCVCGHLYLKSENSASLSKTESIYWTKESALKALESSFGYVMGSNGALYAIRSKLYSKLPVDKTVMDDFYITAKILMKNYYCIFCKKAAAFEYTSAAKYGEFKRKVRIGRANFNFLFTFLPLLNPLNPLKAYMFLSHKLLRWLSPFLLIIVFASSFLLMNEHLFYKVFLVAELLFILAAILRVRVCNYFLSMNLALFFGFIKSFFKEKSGAWERIKREG